MRQTQSSVLPETSPAVRPERRPAIERIAGWSARHRKTAVFGWLTLVAVLFVAAQALGAVTNCAEATVEHLAVADVGFAGREGDVLLGDRAWRAPRA